MFGNGMDRYRKATATALALMFLFVGLPSILIAQGNGPMGSVPDTDSEPNNSMVEATLIDQGTASVHGALSPQDIDDFYKIVLHVDAAARIADRLDVTIVFDAPNVGPSASLLDQWGFVLDFKTGKDITMSVLTAPDLYGDFYIQVHAGSGVTGYFLNTTVTHQAFTHQDSNNQPASAAVLEPANPFYMSANLSGDPEPSNYQDFYKFRIEALNQGQPGFVSIHMQAGPAAMYRLELYDSYMTSLADKRDLSDPAPKVPVVLSYVTPVAGLFYLRVWAANGTGDYNLTVYLLTITDRTDDDIAHAKELAFNGADPHATSGSDSLGYNTYDPSSGDTKDIYRLDVKAGESIEVKANSAHYNNRTILPDMVLKAYDQDGTPYAFNRSGEHIMGTMEPDADMVLMPAADGPLYISIELVGSAPGGGGYTFDVFRDVPPQVVDGAGAHNITISDAAPVELVDLGALFSDPEGDYLVYSYSIEDSGPTALSSGLDVQITNDKKVVVTPWPRFEGQGRLVLRATERDFGASTEQVYDLTVSRCGCFNVDVLSPYDQTHAFPAAFRLVYGAHETDTSIDLSTLFSDPQGHLIEFSVEGLGVQSFMTDTISDTGLTNGTGPGSNAPLKGSHLDHAVVNGVVKITPGRNPVTSGVASILVLSLTDDAKAREVELDTTVKIRAWPFSGDQTEASEAVTLEIKVSKGPGHAPVWSLPQSVSFKEDGALALDLDQYARDQDKADNGTLTYKVASTGMNISATQLDRHDFMLSSRPNWCGSEKISLTVKDTYGLRTEAFLEVKVGCVPKGPVLILASPPTDEAIAVYEGEQVVFSVIIRDQDTGSFALVFDWYINGYPNVAGGSQTFSFTPSVGMAGTYNVSVDVSNSVTGLGVGANWTLVVKHINQPPKAAIQISGLKNGRVNTTVGEDLRFVGLGSDLEGSKLTYRWDFGDGATAQGARVSHSYNDPGRYIATLVVSDGEFSTYAHVNVTVKVQGSTVATPKGLNMNFGLWGMAILLIVALFGIGSTEPSKFRLFIMLTFLYSKIRGTEVLDHYIRGRIQGYITANPGAHYNMIKSDLQINNGNLAYHLQVLERQGYVKSVRDGIFKRFYPETMKVPRPPSLQERILVLLRTHPGLSQREIARELDQSQSTVNDYVHRMAEANMLKVERTGVTNHCFVVEMD